MRRLGRGVSVVALVVLGCWLALSHRVAQAMDDRGPPPASTTYVQYIDGIVLTNLNETRVYISPTGNDGNDGTEGAPLRWLSTACNMVPRFPRYPFSIHTDAGQYDGCRLEPAEMLGADGGAALGNLYGSYGDFVPSTGDGGGTATSVSSPTTGKAFATLTDTNETWTTDNLAGRQMCITGGGASGQCLPVKGNTATVATVDGQFSPAMSGTTTYAVRYVASVIDGGIPNSNITGNVGLLVQTTPTHQSTAHMQIQRFAFAGMQQPILVSGAKLGVKNCEFHNPTGSGPVGIRLNSNAEVVAQFNSFYSSAAGLFTGNSAGDIGRRLFLSNNDVTTATGYMAGFSGALVHSATSFNHVKCTGGCNPLRFDSIGDGETKYDQAEGATGFLRTSFGTAALGKGVYAIDGITCNDPTTEMLLLSGPVTIKLDTIEGVASTGTNASGKPLYIMGGGAKIIQSSLTAFTASGGTDIYINDTTNGRTMTMANFRAIVPPSILTASGTGLIETGAAAGLSSLEGGGITLVPTATASLTPVAAYLEGFCAYDSTVDRVVCQGQDGTPAYHPQARTDNETFSGTTTTSSLVADQQFDVNSAAADSISSDGGVAIAGTYKSTNATAGLEVADGARLYLNGTTHSRYLVMTGGNYDFTAGSAVTALYSTNVTTSVNAGTFLRVNTTTTLSTCASGTLGELRFDATGGTGGKETKLCVCELASDGTTYRWRNIYNALATAIGTTTTCPDTT